MTEYLTSSQDGSPCKISKFVNAPTLTPGDIKIATCWCHDNSERAGVCGILPILELVFCLNRYLLAGVGRVSVTNIGHRQLKPGAIKQFWPELWPLVSAHLVTSGWSVAPRVTARTGHDVTLNRWLSRAMSPSVIWPRHLYLMWHHFA